jgi:hypothetical protein
VATISFHTGTLDPVGARFIIGGLKFLAPGSSFGRTSPAGCAAAVAASDKGVPAIGDPANPLSVVLPQAEARPTAHPDIQSEIVENRRCDRWIKPLLAVSCGAPEAT